MARVLDTVLNISSSSGNFVCQRWGGCFHRPGMDPVGVRFADGAVWLGGTVDNFFLDHGGGVLGYGQTKRTLVGWQERGGLLRSVSGSGYYALNVGRNWQRGHWWRTAKPNMLWLKLGWSRRETSHMGAETSQGPTIYRFRQEQGLGLAQSNDAVARCWRGHQWGFNSGTGTSGTPWWSWSRAISPIHGSTCVIFWCRGMFLMGRTSTWHNTLEERSGGDGN